MFCRLPLAPIRHSVYFVCVNKPTFLCRFHNSTQPQHSPQLALTSGVVHHLPQMKSSQQNCYLHPIQLLITVKLQFSDLRPLVLCAVPAIKLEQWTVLARVKDGCCDLIQVGARQSWRSFGVCLLSASDSTSYRSWAATFWSETAGVVRCSCHLAWTVDCVGDSLGQRL